MTTDNQDHKHAMARAQQRVRMFLAELIVAMWLTQVGWVTVHSVFDPLILVDIEKFISLITVTGGLVLYIVTKLWPENEK